MGTLRFDVCFPLGAAWDSFVSTWKNSQYFYLDEDPTENINVNPFVKNDNVAPSTEKDNVALPVETDNASQDAKGKEGANNVS